MLTSAPSTRRCMPKDVAAILIIIFVLVGLSWKPAQERSASVRPSGTASIGSTKSTEATSPAATPRDVSNTIIEAQKQAEKIEKTVSKLAEESTRSPYYGKINMSYISSLNNPDPSKEYIRLTTSTKSGEVVDITGWYLKSERTSNWVSIGQASVLPYPYTSSNHQDIILERGDRVFLVKGFSPIGISFRTNVCTGYFEENRTFYPALPRECPRAKDEPLPEFSLDLDREDECLKLIDRIPRCTTRDSEYIRDLPDTVSQSCKTYIATEVNYNSCVDNHIGDGNFAGKEYYYYFKVFGPLWRRNYETINLHDTNGLIVDTISY